MAPPTLTNTKATDSAPTSTPISNNAPTTREDSARPRLILHLNANKRREAEAAARSLQQAQAHLERCRQNLNGHAATESNIAQALLDSAWAAIDNYNRISHPGDLARKTYESARRDFDKTFRLMADDVSKLL